ncbi:hypothetical protein RB195_021504 [Necator americanus]
MYLSSSVNDRKRGESEQAQQTRAERDFENCEKCRKANEFAIPPMYFTCPNHVMVLVCPICLDHEADFHLPENCPSARSGEPTTQNPKVIFVHRDIKRN